MDTDELLGVVGWILILAGAVVALHFEVVL